MRTAGQLNLSELFSEFEDCVRGAYQAFTGYQETYKREVLSLCEAMERRLVKQPHAIKYIITINSCVFFAMLPIFVSDCFKNFPSYNS